MEFTEVQELNNLTAIAKTFQQKQLFESLDVSTVSLRAKRSMTGVENLDYEKVLEDTPPSSPQREHRHQTIVSNLIESGTEQSVEEILKNLETYFEQERASIVPVPIEAENKGPETQTSPAEGNDAEKPEANFEEIPDEKESDEDEEENEDKVNKMNPQFDKIRGDDVSKTYQETKNLKSFLSNSIKSFPMSRQDGAGKRGELKTFRVFFTARENSIIISLNLTQTVLEITKTCLDNFMLNKAKAELIKYPDRPDAYFLKMNLESPPFEKHKMLKEFKISQELVIIENENFDPSKPMNEKNEADTPAKPSLLNIIIHFPNGEAKLNIQMSPDRFVKDLFSRMTLEGRIGYTVSAYTIRTWTDERESRFRDSKNFLDANIPLKSIKFTEDTLQLEVVKKKFADEPNEPQNDPRNLGNKRRADTMGVVPSDQDEHQRKLYNDVSANQYEEFEVTKINESKKRQTRILGIDGFKLYNYTKNYKQEQTGGIGEMFNNLFFSKFGTMNPERLLTDVLEARILKGNLLEIGVRSDGKEKWTSFEAADAKTANQIVDKITYLKEREKGK